MRWDIKSSEKTWHSPYILLIMEPVLIVIDFAPYKITNTKVELIRLIFAHIIITTFCVANNQVPTIEGFICTRQNNIIIFFTEIEIQVWSWKSILH